MMRAKTKNRANEIYAGFLVIVWTLRSLTKSKSYKILAKSRCAQTIGLPISMN